MVWPGNNLLEAHERGMHHPDDDPLYRLLDRCLTLRGVRKWTLRWPEIDLALRDAVAQWRQQEADRGVAR